MNRRGKLMLTALAVALMTLALVPAASRMMATQDADKRRTVADAIAWQEAYLMQPTAAAVEPMLEIEDVWAIEDAREMAEAELVTGMYNGSDELGFDVQSQTFYCTLGVDNGADWPELALRAGGVQGMRVAWVDDYSYDLCEEAVAEGYRYELLAYTDTQYAYIGVVFTGLPVVTLHTPSGITDADTPARATIAAAGQEAISSAALVHLRGGGYQKPIDKWSYRLELHELNAHSGDTRRLESVLGMEADSDWLLLANAQDNTTVRNKLAWDIWNDWFGEGEGPLQLQSEMVELFVNDEYVGIYQLMQRVQEERELARIGGSSQTDSVARIISNCNPSTKPLWDLQPEGLSFLLEYRYEPHGDAQRLFALMKDYAALSQKQEELQLDDETFARLALERVDVRSMMDYILFFHACQLRDNIGNNIYLFVVRQEDGKMRYLHAPWDMDTAFWVKPPSEPHNSLRWPDVSMVLPKRMLDLNVGGCREMIWEMWREKRATILSNEAIYNRFIEMEAYINASGAYLRESQKWYGEEKKLNLSELEYYEEQSLGLVELVLEDLWPVEGQKLAQ